MNHSLPDVLTMAHDLAARALDPGGVAVDATVGNGHDTMFLAHTVGRDGQVHGFDVQDTALRRTRDRLEAHDCTAPVALHAAGHEAMRPHLPAETHGSVDVVMFNLGYLPDSALDCITRPDTTVSALEATAEVLRSGGVATVVLYTGHEGGPAEAEAVDAWARARDPHHLQARTYAPLNQPNDPPRLVVLEKQ